MDALNISGFEELSKKEMAVIYNAASTKKFKPGEAIVREGETDKAFFLISEGVVGVFKKSSGVQIHLDTLKAGEWVGEIAMTVNSPRVATVLAVTQVTAMAFTLEAYNALPEKIRIHFEKLFLGLATKRLAALERKMSDSSDKLARLGAYVSAFQEKADACVETELVQDVIRKIPKLPPFVGGLASKIMDAKVSMADAAESIKGDPSLTSLVLKTINSPYYGLREKISDIYRAYLFLGSNQVYNIVMEEGLQSVMPKTPEFRELQQHSSLVSIISYEVSNLSRQKESSSVNGTIGILHDIGDSIVMLLKRQNPKMGPLLDLLNASKLGSQLLQSWGLPEKLCEAVRLQKRPEFVHPDRLPEPLRDNIAALYVAHRCAERLVNADGFEGREIYFDNYAACLGVRTAGCEGFLTSAVLPALNKNKNSYQKWLRDILESRQSG